MSVYMLNALWFKPDGGRETYLEYIKAADPLVQKHGGRRVTELFAPVSAIRGHLDADMLFVVEYPDDAALPALIADPEYQKIRHLRDDAITDSWLIKMEAAPGPE